MKKTLLIFGILILALSCSKKKTKESLLGEWEVVSYLESIGGGATSQEISAGYQLTFIFEDALVKPEGYCPMIWKETYPSGTTSSSLQYKVTDGGDLIAVRNPSNADVVISFSVIDISDEEMILDALIEGATSTLRLEKK